MMQVVLDTSVLVSGYLWWGESRQCLDVGRSGGVALHSCSEIEDEFTNILLSRNFALSRDEVDMLLVDYHSFVRSSELAAPPTDAPAAVREHPALAFALSCGAKLVVSGDKRLLAMKRFRGVTVIAPIDMLRRVDNERKAQRHNERKNPIFSPQRRGDAEESRNC